MVEARFKFYGMLENSKTIFKWFVSPHKSNKVKQIEREVSGFLGQTNFKFTTQCRSAIYLAVKHIINETHDEIIVPAYTIYDVLNMIIAAGGTPVLVDVSETSGNIDINSFKTAITKRTAAILVPHLHGIPADAASIRKLCDAHKILFIEDVAQANGSRFEGKSIGTFGDISVYSFGRAKNINSFFGGGISCNHEKIRKNIHREIDGWPIFSNIRFLKRVVLTTISHLAVSNLIFNLITFRYLRHNLRRNGENAMKALATENNPTLRTKLPKWYASRIMNIQALMVKEQIKNFQSRTEWRLKIAEIYKNGIHFNKDFYYLKSDPRGDEIYMQFPIVVPNRYDLGKTLLESNCDVAFQHLNNLAQVDCFKAYSKDCPGAKKLASSVLLLPTYPCFSEKSARKIVLKINEYIDARS